MDLATLTRNRSIYFSDRQDDLPIVIDTGASTSLTPNINDFVGDLQLPSITEITGLTSTSPVKGEGTVEWTIVDIFGTVRTIQTTAYYVPAATIRLFSPQTYFQEHDAGECRINSRRTSVELADGSLLEFPFNHESNLPLMLPAEPAHTCTMGLTFEDAEALGSLSNLRWNLSVADQTNQNLTAAQRELLLIHWKLGHPHLQWVQKLTADTRERQQIIVTKESKVSSCPIPLCAACNLSKQNRRTPATESRQNIPEADMTLRRGHLHAGDMVSIDQYMSALPGRLCHTKGKEPKKDKFTGGTLFVDHATSYIYLRNQVSLNTGETLQSKKAFEQVASQFGITIKGFRADNVPFGSAAFMQNLADNDQTMTFSGTGAHHQNGVAERAIKTVTSWARAMLLHAIIMWPDQANLALWPFALEHAVYLWNNLPTQSSLLAPIEFFSGTKFPSYAHLCRAHVWGCPVYVLDPKLQDGHKIPKWHPRSRRGQYLGVSPVHSSTIGRILNLRTGYVSPQYHVVYDDLFSTVPNAEAGGIFEVQSFDQATWARILQSGHERAFPVDREHDEFGHLLPLPDLHADWLTPMEQQLRDRHRRRRRPDVLQLSPPTTGPVAGPEGRAESEDEEDEPAPPEGNDDELSISEGGDESSLQDSLPDLPPEGDPPGNLDEEDDAVVIEERQQPTTTRGGRHTRRPQRLVETMYTNHQAHIKNRHKRRCGFKANTYAYGKDPKQKVKAGKLNDQFLMALQWTHTVEFLKSKDLRAMMTLLDQHTDPDDKTVEWMHPMALAAQAENDNPTWNEAMNSPDQAGYWEACKK